MALVCAMSLNTQRYTAGASPSPQATLTVGNPNAVAVAVTGIQLSVFDVAGRPLNAAINLPTPAMGPGQNVVAPAAGSINFGPFPIAVGSAAAGVAITSTALPAGTSPVNAQLAEPVQTTLFIGGVVTGSDGSSNTIVPIGLTVSYSSLPALLSQGGVLSFNAGQNLLTGLVMGVL